VIDPIQLYHGDFFEWYRDIEPGSVDLVFGDPPFGIDFDYGDGQYRDNLNLDEYLAFSRKWISRANRTLRPGGTFWIAIGDEYAAELCTIAKGFGLTMRNWCIWYYTFGPHLTAKFGRNKAHLLYFVKGDGFTFNPDEIRVESERQRMGDPRANPEGRVPGDVWEVPRLPGNAKERTGHPCQMPEEVLARIILSTSKPNGLVLDPFGGSFVTAAVCKEHGRRCVSGDISEQFYREGIERLSLVVPSLFSLTPEPELSPC
jgi:DNA modification methylase